MATDPNTIVDLDEDLDDGSPEPQTPEAPEASKPDELKLAMAELAGTVKKLAEPKAPAEPELTEEQKQEFWAVYNPEKSNKDFMKKWFRLNPDATDEEVAEVKSLWSDAQQGLVKQAVVGSRNLMQIELKKRDEQIAELREYVSQQRASQTKARFSESYPEFADKKYGKILSIKAQELANQTFADEAAFFKALAEGAAEDIRVYIPDFALGASQTTKQKSAGTSPRLPRTSVGGTGGAGGGTREALSVKGDATDEFLDD